VSTAKVAGLDVTIEAGKPAVVTVDGGDAGSWLAAYRDALREATVTHGAVLVRGLGVCDVAGAARVARTLAPGLLTEREGFAPRDEHDEGIYSSSKWPPDQPMCMHHELSYRREFPALLVLTCLHAAESGGATALADAGAVLRALPADLVERFERVGWQLVRNYNELVGVPLTDAFGSDDRAEVERYCRANDIEFRWGDEGELHTRQRRPAVVRHPVTGERCWFNQIAFLNEGTMDPEVREYLKAQFGPDGLPFTTMFGDGEPLTEETVELINEVYDQHTVREPWRAGDVMLVDNVRMAHSREPYTGRREVVVAMGEPTRYHGRP
jgi:alpha-ketoglutarate-dependent taurine dioxygenase